jgi:ubiquitin-protein ligase
MSLAISKKRLLKDYREIMKNKYISIMPLENNIFEWHGNLVPSEGRYKGIILHIIMKFPDTYPSDPPIVNLLTSIPHSNIINYQGNSNFLCIDMLKNFFWMEGGEDKSRPYSGWSSAYTVESIMLQLNSFLFDDFVENYDGTIKHTFYQLAPENGGGNRNLDSASGDIEKAFLESKNCKCEICGHTYDIPFPAIEIKIPKQSEIIIRKKVYENDKMNPEIKNILDNYYQINKKDIEKIYLKSQEDITKENLLIIMEKINKYNSIYSSFINNVPDIYVTRFLKGIWKKLEFEPMINCNCNFCNEYNNANADNEINKKKNKKDFYLKINNFIDKCINTEICKDENHIWNILYQLGYDDKLKKNIKNKIIYYIDKKLSFSDVVKGVNIQKYKKTFFEKLNENSNLYILDFLSNEQIIKIKNISPEIEKIAFRPYLWERREQICFYTKENFDSDILGFDISISFFYKTDKIKEITTNLDIISLTAYQNNIRVTVWNNKFQYWLPLYITKKHMLKGKSYFEEEICKIISARRIFTKEFKNIENTDNGLYSLANAIEKFKNLKVEFKPEYCLQVLVTLMNTMCVNMMKDDSIISERSLEGFCQFHRILLQYIEWYPELSDKINNKIKSFMNGNTSKYYFPSLGEFIILLSLTDDYTWDDIKYNYIDENFDRSTLWILKKYPELESDQYYSESFDKERIEKSWESTKVGKKLLAFNIYFNCHNIKTKSLKNIAYSYDKYYGKPSKKLKEDFFYILKKIKDINSYQEYLKFINYDYIPNKIIAKKLKYSIINSKKKKYHNPKTDIINLEYSKISWRKSN